mmetsp:Transcript_4667/g.18683  ORF Transcript_4667/g.18683 Transcript_4667/m.18683 type:complete len:280 (-) Transcript_4667:2449-3288(-)
MRPNSPRLAFAAAAAAISWACFSDAASDARPCAACAACAMAVAAAASPAMPACASCGSKALLPFKSGAAAKISRTCTPSSGVASASAPVVASRHVASIGAGSPCPFNSQRPTASANDEAPRGLMPGMEISFSIPALLRATMAPPADSESDSGGQTAPAHSHTSPSSAAHLNRAEPLSAIPVISFAAYRRAVLCDTTTTKAGSAVASSVASDLGVAPAAPSAPIHGRLGTAARAAIARPSASSTSSVRPTPLAFGVMVPMRFFPSSSTPMQNAVPSAARA